MKSFVLSLALFSAFMLFSCQSTDSPTEEEVVEVEEVIEEPEIQILEPVKWEYATEKLGDNQYKIIFNASVEDHWYVYSSDIPEDGPIPTTIYYDENKAIGELSEVEESGEVTKDGYDEMFDMDIKKFGHAATFSQVITTTAPTTITGYLEFMTCDSIQCLFPDPIEFTIDAN